MSYRTNDPLGTISGDLTGNEATATVISITGESGTVNISSSGNIITWNKATASPGITQSTPTSDVATQNITITSQAPYASASTNKNPGNILLNVPSPVSGGNSGFVEFQQGGSTIVAIGELVGGSNPAIYLQSAPSSSNWSLQQSGTAFNINSAGTVNTYIGGSQLCLQVSSSAITSSLGTIEWSSSSTLPTLTQITPSSDVAVANLTIQSQAPYASASAHQTPGNIVLNTPSPISSASPGFVQIQSGGTNYLQAGQLSNGSSYGGLWMGNVSPSSSNYTIASSGTDTILNSTSITSLAVNGTNYLALSSTYVQLTAPALEWTVAVSSPSLSQLTQTSDTATHNLTIQAQSAYASASTNTTGANLVLEAGAGATSNATYTSGNVIAYVNAPNSGGTEAYFEVSRAGTVLAHLGAQVGTTSSGALYLTNATPSSSNFIVSSDGTNSFVNIPGSGSLDIFLEGTGENNSTYLVSFNGSGTTFAAPGFFVVANAVSPNWSQNAKASTSSASGANAQTFSFTAQAGQAATGASHNGGTGGSLVLAGGAGGTSGSATAGVGGNVSIASGMLQQTITVTNSTYTCDTNTTTSDLVVLVNYAGAQTLTLPAVASGRTVYVKDKSGAAATNNITIEGASGNVDGASTYVLSKNYGSVMLVSDGINWFVIGEYNGTII